MTQAILRFSLLLVLFTVSESAFAQPSNHKLAEQYFVEGEYDKAVIYYEQLFSERKGNYYFKKLTDCYLALDRIEDAEKLVKKQISRHSNSPELYVKLGTIYRDNGDDKKAQKAFQSAIKNMQANQSMITNVARAFTAAGEYEYAIDAYNRGRRLIDGFYSFNYEVAEVYGLMGRYDDMIAMYLDLIDQNSGYQQTVLNVLNRNFDFEEDNAQNEALRKQLLLKIQSAPDKPVFAEMLIWYFMQRDQYQAALNQVIALDRRYSENGGRLMVFGNDALKSEKFDVAISSYEAVAAKGKSYPFYLDSKQQIIEAQYQNLQANRASKAQWIALKNDANRFIREEGLNEETIESARKLAYLQAYKANELDSAILLMESALEINHLPEKTIAKCKIDLGDYLLINDQIWDASLYYMQAESMFKFDPVGDEAKLKTAKIAYYTGEFEWAKAQVDVLKGSVSKLIANDAMNLSKLITDNTTVDTNLVPLQKYAEAELMLMQSKYEGAEKLLNDIISEFPAHSIIDESYMLKYNVYMEQSDFDMAATSLDYIINKESDDLLKDDALILLAELNQYQLDDQEKAKELYLIILSEHPDSLHTVKAREQYRILRGDQI